MHEIKTTMASTRLDGHIERFAVAALEDAVKQISRSYIPFIKEHDPREPPLGRVIDAKVLEAEDGEFELIVTVELFEGHPPVYAHSERTSPIPDHGEANLVVTFDRGFNSEAQLDLIEKLGKVLDSTPIEEGKKALDPLSVLTIGGGLFVLGKFAGAFFGKLGAISGDVFADYIKRLVSKDRTDANTEKLLKFQFVSGSNSDQLYVDVVLTGPIDADIDSFLSKGIAELDSALVALQSDVAEINRIVFEYSEASLVLTFKVRKDGWPIRMGSK